jgi:hypothetical protein
VTHEQLFSPDVIADGALPTKNSNAIESQLYRLNTTRYFVYVNDDMIIGKPLNKDELIDPKTNQLVSVFI